ncbi:Uncharacterized protein Rs2_40568 [Raphanus sativus]|nr:Uncharacterized protein Rs2_40568 [Raphanus sativus]
MDVYGSPIYEIYEQIADFSTYHCPILEIRDDEDRSYCFYPRRDIEMVECIEKMDIKRSPMEHVRVQNSLKAMNGDEYMVKISRDIGGGVGNHRLHGNRNPPDQGRAKSFFANHHREANNETPDQGQTNNLFSRIPCVSHRFKKAYVRKKRSVEVKEAVEDKGSDSFVEPSE